MRKVILALTVAATTAAFAAPMQAQAGLTFGLSGGVALPMGDAGDVLKTGFGGGAAIMMRDPSARVGFGIDAQYYRFSYDDATIGEALNARQNLYGVMARLDYSAGGTLYLLGGAGLFRGEVTGDDSAPDFSETTNTDFAIQAGLGLNFARGLFAEAKYVNIFSDNSNTSFIPITVGIRF